MAKDIEESRPSKLTVYPASIVTKHGDNDTGIYFPDTYVPGGTVNLLVYFHGAPEPCGGKAADKISDFLHDSTFPLRELTNKGGRNMVLVAPRLFWGGGELQLDMTADDFLKTVVAFIAARVQKSPFSWQAPTASKDTKDTGGMSIGTLILAGHSAGGNPMLEMARTVTVAKVKECWGFDSMYKNPDLWVEWAAKGGKFFLFWTKEGDNNKKKPDDNVTKIQDILKQADAAGSGASKDPAATQAKLAAPNVIVVHADDPKDATKGFSKPPGRAFTRLTTNHCEVPKTYWDEMMKSF